MSSSTTTLVPLDDTDKGIQMMGAPPVTTVTWFRGDRNKAHNIIEKRMIEMIRLNPWLQGRIVKRHGQLCVEYDPEVAKKPTIDSPFGPTLMNLDEPDSAVYFNEDDGGLPKLDQRKIKARVALKGKLDLKQPLWRATLIPCAKSPNDRFALFFSVSHVVGDGFSFYQLYNMLVCGEKMRELKLDRIERAPQKMLKFLRQKESTQVLLLIMMLVGLFQRYVMGKKTTSRSFFVDSDKLAVMKASQKGEQAFISTNDIIFSWFVTQVNCVVGMIAANMRGRVDEITNDRIGNYSSLFRLDTSTSASCPSNVRKCVNNMGIQEDFAPWSMVICSAVGSNWASFAAENTDIIGCEELVHVASLDEPTVFPNWPGAIIFRARPNQLGVCLLGQPHHVELTAPFELTKCL